MADLRIEFNPSVERDLGDLNINQVLFQEIYEKIKQASLELDLRTSRIRGLPENFRKLKLAEFRIVLWQGKGTLYVIKIFHRRQGYSKESLENIMKLIREYTG